MPPAPIPAPSVIAGLKFALRPHAPFAAMADADLERVVRAAQIRYFAPGEIILAPDSSRPAHCYVIRQGTVRGERPGATGDAAALWELSAGEMFPLGALLARRGVTSVYRATRDTFCLAFPVALFDTLIETSPVFQDFCTRRLAYLLDLSRANCRPSTRRMSRSSAAWPRASRRSSVTRRCRARPRPRWPTRWRRWRNTGSGRCRSSTTPTRPLGIFTRQDVIGRIVLPCAAAGHADRRRHERAADHAAAVGDGRRRGAADGAPRHPARAADRRRRRPRGCRVRARPVQPAAAVGARARVGGSARPRHRDAGAVRDRHPRTFAVAGRAGRGGGPADANDLEPQRPDRRARAGADRAEARPRGSGAVLAGHGLGGTRRADGRDRPGQRPHLRQQRRGDAAGRRPPSGCCPSRARSTKGSTAAATRCARAA